MNEAIAYTETERRILVEWAETKWGDRRPSVLGTRVAIRYEATLRQLEAELAKVTAERDNEKQQRIIYDGQLHGAREEIAKLDHELAKVRSERDAWQARAEKALRELEEAQWRMAP